MTSLADVLRQIRQERGGAGAVVPLTTLGSLVAGRLRDWPRPLSQFLAGMPTFCEVEAGNVRFRDGEPDVEGALAAMASASSPQPRVRQDLFTAMIAAREDEGWFLDLETHSILRVEAPGGVPGAPVATEPVRYVRVPTISTSEQIAFAVTTLGAALPPDRWEAVRAAGAGWARVVERTVPRDLWMAFLAKRQAEIVKHAAEWVQRHQLRPEKFLAADGPGLRAAIGGDRERPQVRSSTSLGPSRDRGDPSAADPTALLRRRLHGCIERMTLEELAGLRVPARFLVADD